MNNITNAWVIIKIIGNYEIGTNSIFDDRAEEAAGHNPVEGLALPKKKPDRIYGLRATKIFEILLSKPMDFPSTVACNTIGDLVATSPFKYEPDPLLFPFLVVEAKSEHSPNGFDDIRVQTSFPILLLLKLQEKLQEKAANQISGPPPLVWFFAYRGDAWRVYTCYIKKIGEKSGCEITQLWHGCILSKDDALRLLLIVNYVFDWARNLYRPSILRRLKCLASGKAYDQVTLTTDSDIPSMKAEKTSISNWIQPPLDIGDGFVAVALNEQTLLPLSIQSRAVATLKLASHISFRLDALYVTEDNINHLLQATSGIRKDTNGTK